MGSFLEWFLESSLLVLMIIGIRKIFMGRIRYGIIYALWLLVLLRFAIPVNLISTPVSVANIMSETFTSWETSQNSAQVESGINGTSENVLPGIGGMSTGISSDKKASANYQQTGHSEMGTGNVLPQQGIGHSQEKTTGDEKREGYLRWWKLFKAVRFPVSALLFLWLFVTNAGLLRRLKKERVLYGEREGLKIYIVSGIKNPCLYGFLRPVVYLPNFLVSGEGGQRADEEELEQMITHELVHYRHGDYIWALLRILFVSLYWFNPFAWLAASCSKKDAELFCDETVIHRLGEEKRFCYGEMLVRLAGDARFGDFRYSMMSMSRRGKEMKSRIRAISEKRSYSKWVLIPLTAVLLVAVGITCSSGIPALSDGKKTADNASEEKTVSGAAVKNADEKNGQTAKEMLAETGQATAFSQPVGFLQTSGTLFRGNSYLTMGKVKEKANFSILHRNASEAFEHYIEVFTNAVNTGNTEGMNQVLAPDRAVYRQQCDLVKNYYRRGIREEVKACSIASERKVSPNYVEIDSSEQIEVFFADASVKIINQSYRYTCEYVDRTWIITKMTDIS